MFKKLRNKLLLMNLVMISILMFGGFTSIYVFTYNDVQSSIQMDLYRISDFQSHGGGFKQPPDIVVEPKVPKDALSNRSVSFILLTDSNWHIVNSTTYFDMDSSFFEAAKAAAKKDNSDYGTIDLEDNHWAYLITPYVDGYKLVFLDVSNQQALLTRLIYTFLVVAVIMLLLIFLISRFLTNKSIQPVKAAFDKQKQFIGDASHELKTPLAVIQTNVDVLLSNSESTVASQTKWLHYIQSEAQRMNKLVHDLLYLTQVDHSDMKMIFTDYDLSQSIESTLLTMEAIAYEKNLQLNYAIDPGIKINGNSEQITQVVMILLDNAIKYASKNGTVHLSLNKHNQHVHLILTNTGEGISNEHLDKIFDRFYRLDPSRTRNSGGYGLGLSIAKAIVDLHGGKISVSSIVGQSTTFKVKLPATAL